MGWGEEADQFWTLGKMRFEARAMAEPGLPFSLFCLNRESAGIYLRLRYNVAAEATRAPLDCDFALRYIFTHGANYTGRLDITVLSSTVKSKYQKSRQAS
jgi:hypothetical protein